ncbi:uncharacterized protein LOC117648680 [Thrips palmi]|uniref:Uncharacterized protein LOC117648680 n=1 Tax=Thrips palmi TaxID=161013 RepID=A0A6P8ZR99_THRPL|nr:uncharacterized protein LOC117648680 [Thrips palmi]XP_034247234.1 uncharacterized protein LOC117648680 [Thrips palmi]XP_034247235.1 uncharacterized protein LOC117648680 [Thrips palmi]XP_034247236.1 uncharacterized protein LOC117648680 [Thrips palmi]XP_034247237.1 uncharacterized protein LOC117648680 [Thrips palmi]XP_034247238.1 uncharacterized protein LOC117648680 [Thrips palmi]
MPIQEVIVGVDFGTTNSVVAVYQHDGVEVLTNDIDSRKTPSCVYINDKDREVGEAALRMAPSFPEYTIRNVKSVLGVTMSALGDRVPLGAVRIEGTSPTNAIAVKIANMKCFQSEEIAAMVLLELKKSAEAQLASKLNEAVKVNRAVVAVPSYFGACQRRAVIDAAHLAGLQVTGLVNETTAAAVAYAHDREDPKTVVLVDIGGGGSSMSVVKVECNQVWVQAHSGPRLPGGEDFDNKMMEFLGQCVEKDLGKEVNDPHDREILRSHWVKAKEKLSRIPQVSFVVFLPGIGLEFAADVNRSDFQAQCGDLFREITDGLLRTLEGVRVDEVHEVLLVGGSTRIPLLRTLIQKELPGKPLSKAINPDEAVAEGAALLAAGFVEVKREVLSLKTEVTMAEKCSIFARNTELPQRRDSSKFWNQAIEVHQEIQIGQRAPVVNFRRRGMKYVEIDASGLLHVRDGGGEVKCLLSGCLTPASIEKHRKRMDTYKQNELTESERIESKNALDELLRMERGKQALPDDLFHKEAMELRDECGRLLDWLAENSDEQAKVYDERRIQVEGRVAHLRDKRMNEQQRVAAKDRLREALAATIAAEIPEDPFREKALELKNYCEMQLDEFGVHESSSKSKLDQELDHVLERVSDLERQRERHAELQRQEEARASFENAVIKTTVSWTDKTSFGHYFEKIMRLCHDAKRWLESRGTAVDVAICKQQHESFDREVSALDAEVKREIRQAEERRQRAKASADSMLQEALSVQIPKEDDRLYSVTKMYVEHWKESFELLQKSPSESQSVYEKITKDVDAEMTEFRRLQAKEAERVRLTALIEATLTNGLQEFKDNQDDDSLLIQLKTWYRKWLDNNPEASNQDLDLCRARVDEVMESLRKARHHQLIQEKESSSVQEARKQAISCAEKLLLDFGFKELSVSKSSRAAYVPEHFTQTADEEPMDVDTGDQASNEIKNGAIFDNNTMIEVWQSFQQPADRQRPELLSHRSPNQCQAILESLSEEVALEALVVAGSAGLMALLLDREVTADQELVSLSVRYVSITGSPDERLLLVQDRRAFNGQGKEFAISLFRRFKELCEKAGIASQMRLEFLSAPDCGSFVPFFVALAQQDGWGISRADSISEPLDKRLAVAFYESVHPDDAICVTVLSTIDTLRQKFAVDSKWFPMLRRHCNFVGVDDPWVTYTSSTEFVLRHRKGLADLLCCVVKSDPKEKIIMDSINLKLGEFLFTSCLVAFDGVFAQLQSDPDQEKDLNSGWKSILSRMEGHEAVLMGNQFQDFLISRIILTTGVSCMTRENKARTLVDNVIRLAINITKQSLIGFEDCRVVQRCLESQEDKSGGRYDKPNHKFYQELLSFRAEYSRASFDLSCILRQKLRHEFRKDVPALYAAVQRALTVPLLPPMSERSAVQLRQGARRTNAALRVFNSAAVPIAARKYRPLNETIARAVASVLSKCPELKGTHPGCIPTAL